MPNLLIHSPYTERASQGNSITALRLEEIFAESGWGVAHSQNEYTGGAADVMIALNARKSAQAAARFRYMHPDAGLVIILTGTDINHPDVIDESSATWISMKLADRLVVLHEQSLKQVPEKFRGKTRVIYPSVSIPDELGHEPGEGGFTVVMAGNMRQEKNPGLAMAAAGKLTGGQKIHFYGESGSMDSECVTDHGVVAHDEILRAMAKADVLLNTSLQEGGANAICEAICLGLPVVASAIPGNVGMLGEDYVGLYPSNDVNALVSMLEKAAGDPPFYALMKEQVATRAPMFAWERESQSWQDLLAELSN